MEETFLVYLKMAAETKMADFGSPFYLPHMKYGKVLVSSREIEKNFFAFFHVL